MIIILEQECVNDNFRLLKHIFNNKTELINFAMQQDILKETFKPASIVDFFKQIIGKTWKAKLEAPASGWSALAEVRND